MNIIVLNKCIEITITSRVILFFSNLRIKLKISVLKTLDKK
jgi:hypothetical protein